MQFNIAKAENNKFTVHFTCYLLFLGIKSDDLSHATHHRKIEISFFVQKVNI